MLQCLHRQTSNILLRQKTAHTPLAIVALRRCLSSSTPNEPSSPALTHVDSEGNAHMVDVGHKPSTLRTAVARGRVLMPSATLELIKADKVKKGNVLSVAQIAGIQGAKSCAQLIPLCHPLNLTKVSVTLTTVQSGDNCAVEIEATVKCKGETGVEMEALSAVSAAALTVFDMCKAVCKSMVIGGIRVVEKTGGKSGHWRQD